MGHVTSNQPLGTPTWIDLSVPNAEHAMAFYRALFGWEYQADRGPYIMCLLNGRPVAAILPNPDTTDFVGWKVYLATADCDDTAQRVTEAGGTLLEAPRDVLDLGRMTIATDPVGARFGLWQGRTHLGCQLVNEPNTLVRNDLVTPNPEPARAFYAAVFGFTLDHNEDLLDFDFTFLRRPDGHEVGGIFGSPGTSSSWTTTFEVADTDAVVARATAAGGTASDPNDMLYGRLATITDPFGAEFSVIARPPAQPG